MNLEKLTLCWAITLICSTLLTTIGPKSAAIVSSFKYLESFTIGFMALGAALSSLPSITLFKKFGRKQIFFVGCLIQFFGGLLGVCAMQNSNISLLLICCLLIGLAQGLGRFYRFAAVEVDVETDRGRAITFVISGGILAAIIGPSMATLTTTFFQSKYYVNYLFVCIISIIQAFIVLTIDFPKHNNEIFYQREIFLQSYQIDAIIIKKSLGALFMQPLFLLSCFINTISNSIMFTIMSVIMIVLQDESVSTDNQMYLLEAHYLAMFVPSIFSGYLVSRYGTFTVHLWGNILCFLSLPFLLSGVKLWNFYLGVILNGVAWNFSFSAGTVMLTDCYNNREEAYTVQGFNDFIMFGVSGIVSFAAGFIYTFSGWDTVLYTIIGLMVADALVIAMVWFSRRRSLAAGVGNLQYSLIRTVDTDDIL